MHLCYKFTFFLNFAIHFTILIVITTMDHFGGLLNFNFLQITCQMLFILAWFLLIFFLPNASLVEFYDYRVYMLQIYHFFSESWRWSWTILQIDWALKSVWCASFLHHHIHTCNNTGQHNYHHIYIYLYILVYISLSICSVRIKIRMLKYRWLSPRLQHIYSKSLICVFNPDVTITPYNKYLLHEVFHLVHFVN